MSATFSLLMSNSFAVNLRGGGGARRGAIGRQQCLICAKAALSADRPNHSHCSARVRGTRGRGSAGGAHQKPVGRSPAVASSR